MEAVNSLKMNVFSLPQLIVQQYEDLLPKIASVLSKKEILKIDRIILTGCGDSYAAALAMKYAFEMLTNVPTQVVSAIELSRFYDRDQMKAAADRLLVVSVCISGDCARVCEALKRASECGVTTVALTQMADTLIQHCAGRFLYLDIPSYVSAPGTRSYVAGMMALLLFAIHIGREKERYCTEQTEYYYRDILMQSERLEQLLPELDQHARKIAQIWQYFEAFDFIGAGFDYANAYYGCAKVYEALGWYAMHNNTEDWMHTNFFMRNLDKIATVVIANTTNPAVSRSKELLRALEQMGRPHILITDGDAEYFGSRAETFCVPKAEYPFNMVLTQFTPINLILGYMMDLTGETDGRGCLGPWSMAENRGTVRNSKIIII